MRESAGLEARRNEQCVRSSLNQMRERLIVTNQCTDASRRPASCRNEAVFQGAVARPEQHELRSCALDCGQRIEQQVHALLMGQSAHDPEQTGLRFHVETKARLQRLLVGDPFCGMLGVEGGGEPGIGGRIPYRVIDAIEDGGERAGAMSQQSFEAHARLWRLDLGGVRWRNSGDAIGQRKARLEITDASVIFDAIHRECAWR